MSPAPFPGVERRPASATRAELQAQRAVIASQERVLPTLRAQGEKWAITVTGLLGTTGLAALIAGPSQFATLAGPWDSIAGALFFIGGAAGVFALLRASQAAQVGFARDILSGRRQKDHVRSRTDTALAQLSESRHATTLAVACILLSALVLWAMPTESRALALEGTTKAGEVVCGTLARSGEAPILKVGDRSFRLLALAEVRATKSC